MGDMLKQSWEAWAIEIANATDVVSTILKIVKEESIDLSADANVVVARDTRPSGEVLVASLIDGVNSMSGNITDFGLMTTPQLHYVIRCLNTHNTSESYGVPTAEGYYTKLSEAFKSIVVSP
jgi:phosphoacetylglucosamine mutase